MILTFLYHQVDNGKRSNKYFVLNEHLNYISKNYKTVTPGDNIFFLKTQICLTFDDATKDFYTAVFPLLKKYKLKALLAVPVAFIEKENYCTWHMLKEMVESNHVKIASHSYNHFDMTSNEINPQIECLQSKLILEKKLKTKIDTFVYPYGKFNKLVHSIVKKHYKYAMRIGSSLNLGWNNFSGLIYRVPSDRLKNYKSNLLKRHLFKYFLKLFINSIRGK